jgi:alkylhydroperoxidase family enzyme
VSPERVPPLSPDEAAAAAAASGLPEYLAGLNVFRVLLRSPQVASAFNDWLRPLLFEGRLDVRLRELVIMRLGWATGSVYEWTQHWRIATDLGVPTDDLLAVRDWRASDRLGDVERVALAATDEVIEHGVISTETWRACEAALPTVEERLELVAVIAGWRMVSSVLGSLDVALEDGVAPWPPDGVSPGDRS